MSRPAIWLAPARSGDAGAHADAHAAATGGGFCAPDSAAAAQVEARALGSQPIYVAAGDEATRETWIWDACGRVAARLAAHSTPVLDVAHSCGWGEDSAEIVATLSEGELKLHFASASSGDLE